MPFENLIGGAWTAGTEVIVNRNPSDFNDTVGEYAVATDEQVDDAIAAAKAALPAWAEASPQLRADLLNAVAERLEAEREPLGELLAREEGKIRADGIAEVVRSAHFFRYFAGEALRIGGYVGPSVRQDVRVSVMRRPIGVVGLICPWNFPIAIPAWKTAPALAYGNTVVFKPSEWTPAMGYALARIIHECGAPGGVFNLVMGDGRVGGRMAASPGISGISFTGSAGVGRKVIAQVAARGGKVQAELGGKNPLVVLDDADLDNAVECAVNGAFFQTGQRCTASSRLIVTRGIVAAFTEALVARMKALTIGPALASSTVIGPVINEAQLDKDRQYLEIGRLEDGADVALEMHPEFNEPQGHYFGPVLFANTDNAMRINREEIFGPVAGIIPVADYDEALAVANDTDYGLSSGICTRSLKHAQDFLLKSEAGITTVNLPTAGVDYHIPFGGRKGSAYGAKEHGMAAHEFFTETRTGYMLPL
ncbi:MAG: aldehyde dehydrogenase family protein [Rhodospirillaceae bacterium]|nr:aldehyde dehydrogenase family protein [Rhodospirillaceae bacterium]MCA8930914.1 aldehyde dehydrogenase family protein [Rhodospirillaceae bacterium]